MEEVEFISEERLRTFAKFTKRQKNAVALHNHTLQLGSSLMSVIALLELALRNSTNQRLIQDFGNEEWLKPDSTTIPLGSFERKAVNTAIAHAKKAAYSKLNYKEKTALDERAFPAGVPIGIKHKNLVEKRQSLFEVSHGQIVSQTTFSFWKRLYSHDYEASLWKTSLKKVFPNKSLSRSEVAASLEVVYSTRNRVAHHEPVYGPRLDDAMNALNFFRRTLGAKKHDEETAFMRFSQVQTLRLQMDYEAFVRAWDTLVD